MESFDAVDRGILATLRDEGRASLATIAKRVGLSAPAVGERIRKLEGAGVILGYRAHLDAGELGLPICAFVALAARPGTLSADLVERLLELPEIEELHSVAGVYSFIAKVRVRSPEALDDFVDRLMMKEGVERTESTVVLRTSAERPVPLPFDGGTR